MTTFDPEPTCGNRYWHPIIGRPAPSFPYLGDAAIEVVGAVAIYMFGKLGKSKKRKTPS
jgi:hypothetical protein